MQKIVTCVAYNRDPVPLADGWHCNFAFSVVDPSDKTEDSKNNLITIPILVRDDVWLVWVQIEHLTPHDIVKSLFPYARVRIEEKIKQGKLQEADKPLVFEDKGMKLPDPSGLPDSQDFSFTVDLPD